MNYTQENLKWFVLTGVMTATALAVFLSGGQFVPVTGIDFESTLSAEMINQMVFLTYSVHNTGTTSIDSISVTSDCCSASPDDPESGLMHPRNNTGLVSSVLQVNNGSLSRGDYFFVTFVATDTAGNTKTVIEPVLLE